MKGLGGGIISACTIFIGIFGLIIGSCVAKCKKIADLPDDLPDVGSGHLPVSEVRIEEENDEDDLYQCNNEENEEEIAFWSQSFIHQVLAFREDCRLLYILFHQNCRNSQGPAQESLTHTTESSLVHYN